MTKLKTVENRVLEILKDCPASRFDDMLLILHYYNRYGYLRAGELPLEDIVFNYKSYGLPCFESIRRARQRVQSLFRNCPAVKVLKIVVMSVLLSTFSEENCYGSEEKRKHRFAAESKGAGKALRFRL